MFFIVRPPVQFHVPARMLTYMVPTFLHPAIRLVRIPIKVRPASSLSRPHPRGTHQNVDSLVLKKFRPSRCVRCFAFLRVSSHPRCQVVARNYSTSSPRSVNHAERVPRFSGLVGSRDVNH